MLMGKNEKERDKMKSSGVTLLELMITLVVLAILATIAFPSFQAHVVRSRRAEALEHLLSAQLKLEEYRVTNASYATTMAAIGGTSTDYYDYTLTVSGATYTLIATATTGKSQVNDTGCTSLKLRSDPSAPSGDTADLSKLKLPTDCWK